MLFFKASQESRAMMIAADLVRQEGLSDSADLWSQVDKIMGKADVQLLAFEQQARDEGLTGSDIRVRVQELSELQRPGEIQAEPMTYAQQSTFNYPSEGMLGVFARGVRDLTRKLPFGRTVIPFTQIVANVTNVSIDHTPWGFVRAWRGIKDAKGVSRAIVGHRRAQLLAKATIGTAAMVGAYAMDRFGGDDDDGNKLLEVTGAGTGDFTKDNQLKQTGWRPWSIRIRGGKYWDYRLTPLVIGLAIIGSMRDAEKYKKISEEGIWNRLAYTLLKSGDVLFNMSFLSGIDQVMKMIEPGSAESSGRKLQSYVTRTASTIAVPSLLKQIDRTFDPVIHDNATIQEGLLRETPIAIPSRLLGLEHPVKPKINLLGEPIKQTTGPVSIFVSKSLSDPVWKLIVDNEAFISKPSNRTEMGRGIKKRRMTEDEYYEYVKESGQTIREMIERNLSRLQSITKEGRVDDIINDYTRNARKRAKNKIWREAGYQ